MPNISLLVRHRKQIQEADCLATCVAMSLDFIKRSMNYSKILKMLETSPYGAIASRVTRLTRKGLKVIYTEGSLTDLRFFLAQQLPVITLVRTGELPYWDYDTMHAILLVGYDESYFYANDPNFQNAPIKIPVGDFDLAWLEMGNRYIVISS